MLNKKLISVLLDGAVVFTSIILGSKMQELVDEVKILKMKSELSNSIIEGQQKIIEKLQSKKEES